MRSIEKEAEAVLQKAVELANKVSEMAAGLPANQQPWKMRRAAVSTAVNIAEGLAQYHREKQE